MFEFVFWIVIGLAAAIVAGWYLYRDQQPSVVVLATVLVSGLVIGVLFGIMADGGTTAAVAIPVLVVFAIAVWMERQRITGPR